MKYLSNKTLAVLSVPEARVMTNVAITGLEDVITNDESVELAINAVVPVELAMLKDEVAASLMMSISLILPVAVIQSATSDCAVGRVNVALATVGTQATIFPVQTFAAERVVVVPVVRVVLPVP